MVSLRHEGNYIVLETTDTKRRVLMAYKSPSATLEQDMWLARKLKSVYARYYLKVSVGALLNFFGDR